MTVHPAARSESPRFTESRLVHAPQSACPLTPKIMFTFFDLISYNHLQL